MLILDYDLVNKDYISAGESLLYCAISDYVISNMCLHMKKKDTRYDKDRELSKNDLDVEYCKDVLYWTFLYLKTIGDRSDSMCIEEENEYVDDLLLLARTSLEDYDFSSGDELDDLRQMRSMKKNKEHALSIIEYFIREYKIGSINFSDVGIFFNSFGSLYSFLDDPKDKYEDMKEILRGDARIFDDIFEEAVIGTRQVLDYLGVGKKYEDYNFYLEDVTSCTDPKFKSIDGCLDMIFPIRYLNSIKDMVGTMLYGICHSQTGCSEANEDCKEISSFFSMLYCQEILGGDTSSDFNESIIYDATHPDYAKNESLLMSKRTIDKKTKRNIRHALNTGSFDGIRNYIKEYEDKHNVAITK